MCCVKMPVQILAWVYEAPLVHLGQLSTVFLDWKQLCRASSGIPPKNLYQEMQGIQFWACCMWSMCLPLTHGPSPVDFFLVCFYCTIRIELTLKPKQSSTMFKSRPKSISLVYWNISCHNSRLNVLLPLSHECSTACKEPLALPNSLQTRKQTGSYGALQLQRMFRENEPVACCK